MLSHINMYVVLMAHGGGEMTALCQCDRARRQSGFPTFISCQCQDGNVLPKRRQSHQGDKLCDVSTVPLVARWPVFLARGSDVDGEPHWTQILLSGRWGLALKFVTLLCQDLVLLVWWGLPYAVNSAPNDYGLNRCYRTHASNKMWPQCEKGSNSRKFDIL